MLNAAPDLIINLFREIGPDTSGQIAALGGAMARVFSEVETATAPNTLWGAFERDDRCMARPNAAAAALYMGAVVDAGVRRLTTRVV